VTRERRIYSLDLEALEKAIGILPLEGGLGDNGPRPPRVINDTAEPVTCNRTHHLSSNIMSPAK